MKKKEVKQLSHKQKILQRVLFIIGIIFLVCAIAICGIVVFQKTYYTPFWVNGQSMYPTLNKNAKYTDGVLIGEYKSRSDVNFLDVDYGFMATSDNAKNNIKRFDIIVCKYSDSDTSYKIKRVVALPGETFYFVNNPGVNDNGSLYISNAQGEFTLIKQPLEDSYIIRGNYNGAYSSPYTLNDDEYFVLGDNRPHSQDSRSVGPITKKNILGVVAGLNGYATIGYDKSGAYGPTKINHYWPRFF